MRQYKQRYEKQGKPANFVMLAMMTIEEYAEHMVVPVFENHEISCKVGN